MSALPILVAGAGLIGRRHVATIRKSSGATLAGIADPAPAAEKFAAELGVPWDADLETLLDRTRPAAAILATPNAAHAPGALACIARRVAVLIEKPVAGTPEDARTIADAAEAARVPTLVGHHRRHNPILRAARDAVRAGLLGDIVSATALSLFLKPDPYFEVAWRTGRDGGPVLINLIHDIDALRFVVGEIAEVKAMTSTAAKRRAVEDGAVAALRFANGALGTLAVSDAAVAPWSWELTSGENESYPRQADASCLFLAGTKGALDVPQLSFRHYAGAAGWMEPLAARRLDVRPGDSYANQLAHFVALARGEAKSEIDARDAARTLDVALAVRGA
jgi:predicted dehydrogenase